jgi:SOS response regulatory protein OraA/RecX
MFEKRNLQEELKEYFMKNIRKGYSEESLRQALLKQGYSKFEVLKALKKAQLELAETAPKLQEEKPIIRHEIVSSPNNSKFHSPKKKPLWKKLLSPWLGFD